MMNSDELVEQTIEEIKEILDDYDVYEHDVEIVVDKIEHLGTLLAQAYKTGRQLEAYVTDELGQEGLVKFLRIVQGKEQAGEHLKAEC